MFLSTVHVDLATFDSNIPDNYEFEMGDYYLTWQVPSFFGMTSIMNVKQKYCQMEEADVVTDCKCDSYDFLGAEKTSI